MTGRPVNRKRCWYGISRVVPGAIEAHPVVTSSRRDAPVVAQIVNRHIRAALGFAAIPELSDGLPVSEGPG
jgi:hypothetical protein